MGYKGPPLTETHYNHNKIPSNCRRSALTSAYGETGIMRMFIIPNNIYNYIWERCVAM